MCIVHLLSLNRAMLYMHSSLILIWYCQTVCAQFTYFQYVQLGCMCTVPSLGCLVVHSPSMCMSLQTHHSICKSQFGGVFGIIFLPNNSVMSNLFVSAKAHLLSYCCKQNICWKENKSFTKNTQENILQCYSIIYTISG